MIESPATDLVYAARPRRLIEEAFIEDIGIEPDELFIVGATLRDDSFRRSVYVTLCLGALGTIGSEMFP